MQLLKVPFINLEGSPGPQIVSNLLDKYQKVPIACNPWPQYGHEVTASFVMAHSSTAVLLKYYVDESFLLAASASNGDIHKDSCVEFFVAFQDDDKYYNLEFNCIGWHKVGFGATRNNRVPLHLHATDSITTSTHIRSKAERGSRRFNWELTIVIPATVFCFHQISDLATMKVRGNFHKCGDELPTPHFLTWNHVTARTPDFHRKEDFAEILFL
ncbi:Carbohydrate-binding family 9 [Chitinophaga terrae (ex Kim and Jung 2007)]|uniref:Carbohydrate-binding family 9 n=1 Tax=Chitinophaga terrae (ex Kim and Jung 2007) TaxID=408074 RepID=A0A1H4E0H7_9BACT|nr:carbohydrate-binding family 9-like protein [Chitinophaga terrae (ex Kim and Jung 2007)]GEP91255.1 hypothetical protein CTE07_29000 [Chitinophaga terrae (ex Kim and Jung 2007)]SEA78090.1 Carbohydrate-binding family 9 [Chitinophaga terrae (ex Kim and Jung 2007)]